jgi:hypothetical protein
MTKLSSPYEKNESEKAKNRKCRNPEQKRK